MLINIPPSIAHCKRSAWKPLVENRDGTSKDSKFAGIPWLLTTESWPSCQNCNNPMQLFLQLDLGMLPEKIDGEYGNGLLQLFYCTNQELECETDCQAYYPFAKSTLARVIQPNEEAYSLTKLPLTDSFPPKLIVGWEEYDDYPNSEEAELLGITLSDAEAEAVYELGYPRAGDKLGGWPQWIQGVEYPDCPTCGETMRLIFQIDSDNNLPYSFGDVGCAHITQCKNHKEQIAFGWACS